MFRQPSRLQQLRHAILHVIRAIALPIDKVRNHNLKSQVNPFNYHTYRAALTPMPDRIPEWDIEPLRFQFLLFNLDDLTPSWSKLHW